MRKIRKILVFSLVMLLLFSITLNFFSFESSAQGADRGDNGPPFDGGPGDKRRGYEKRDVDLEREDKKAIVKSTWSNEDVSDQLQMVFHYEEGPPKIEVEYQVQKDGEIKGFGFKLVIEEVFEFIDSNSNGRYDDEDEIVSRMELKEDDFTDMEFEENEEGYELRLEDHNSSIQIKAVGGGGFIDHNSQIINPTEMKLDFTYDYDFRSEDSMLGLKMAFMSKYQASLGKETYDEEKGYARGETWMNFQEHNYTGFFSWGNTAQVDGVERPVNTTLKSERAVPGMDDPTVVKDVIYLSYPRGDQIVHDPKVGVVGESSLSFSTQDALSMEYMLMILAVSMVSATVVFSAGVYIRRKY